MTLGAVVLAVGGISTFLAGMVAGGIVAGCIRKRREILG